jgi:hypothetical protein
MSHLGDTNKMVSDTPRMDASAHDDGAIWQTGCEIERELNAASVEIERLRKSNLQLREGAEEQKQRIKRLEEAGDGLSMWVCPEYKSDPANIALQNWHKAKEAKL